MDELPNELPSLDKDLDKEGEAGVGELGEHGGEAGVGEELVGLALPEGEPGVGALGGEPSNSKVQGWLESDAYGKPTSIELTSCRAAELPS